jgi:hypothetical protein
LHIYKIAHAKFACFHICMYYKIIKLQMKNEKSQPTNNNVSKFTSNKTQNYKFTSLQICKLQNKIK